jgi:hypothetical protein
MIDMLLEFITIYIEYVHFFCNYSLNNMVQLFTSYLQCIGILSNLEMVYSILGGVHRLYATRMPFYTKELEHLQF